MKIKTEFQRTADALKVIGKQITGKKDCGRTATMAVFIDRTRAVACATDGIRLAILDMSNHMDPAEIDELAFYADMQALEFSNGWTLISAKKKEAFVAQFGEGMDQIDTKPFDYPDLFRYLPAANELLHVSDTHAVFLPSDICAIDRVATAFDVNDSLSVTAHLYGTTKSKIHVAIYNGLLLGICPVNIPDAALEEAPNDTDYLNAIRFIPDPKEKENQNED